MTHILLTGGTGFVGRQILQRLLDGGASVRLVLRGDAPAPAGVEVWRTDDLFATPDAVLREACDGMDIVLHAAWYAEPGKYVESPRNLDCLSGTLRLAQAAVAAGVARFVGVGTCFEYDLDAGYLRTTTPLAPRTLYGAAKASAFLTLSRLMALEGRSFAWCRLFYLHGEGEDARRLVPHIRARLAAGEPAELTSGRQIRDFLDVAEAGRRIAKAALSGVEGPLNICSGVPVSVADLARRIADEYGRRDLLHFGARPDTPGDPPCIIGEPSVV
ncbi:NAD-dependent epimerase/dehydratase family protein [Paragemmobacter ruber]|uniref:NAD-dependent epimerase/dehydratase family protein n=1 Tax=Paragemmobacter ruber TaxID=1985673 RepID=A0ABW9Y5K5_9RHOB|nr:NAD(P)-dependent oxidoreductase [Rhodobacter ruber]NBE07085.1 NAD-dependent epimerase/dehydratase family protein [Rhodobacter ruber]